MALDRTPSVQNRSGIGRKGSLPANFEVGFRADCFCGYGDDKLYTYFASIAAEEA